MEPSFLRSAAVKGGLNRRIKLDRNAGVDEVHSHTTHCVILLYYLYNHIHVHLSMQPYIEGYLQAMLDTMFKQDYLRVKVVDDEVK